MKNSLGLVLVVVLSLAGANVMAETIAWREGGEYGGDGYTDVTTDDNHFESWLATNRGAAWDLAINPDRVAIMGWTDLFTLVPATSGGLDIQIDSATLTLRESTSGSTYITYLVRVTTPWLVGAAGTNEMNTDDTRSDRGAGTTWASGDWSSADYTTTNQVAFTPAGVKGTVHVLDITALMRDIYDNDFNAGFAFIVPSPGSGVLNLYSSEANYDGGRLDYRPALDMEYQYIPEPATMSLLAIGGIGMLIRRKRRA